jgi:hypothetical protein
MESENSMEEITFPVSHFEPVKIGEFRAVSHLEKLIDLLNIKSNKYILHSKASLLDLHNPEYIGSTLLMATDYFYLVPPSEIEGKFETYSYLEIETILEVSNNNIINLKFYHTEKNEKDPSFESTPTISNSLYSVHSD